MPLTTDFDALIAPLYWVKANCPCCGLSCLDIRLHAALSTLDELIPEGFRVTSLMRCRAHNAAVGGVNQSLHIFGRAADLAPDGIDLFRLISAAMTTPCFEAGGIGLYPDRGIIHVDIRPRPARWGKIGHNTTEFLPTWRAAFPTRPKPDRLQPTSPSPDPRRPAWR